MHGFQQERALSAIFFLLAAVHPLLGQQGASVSELLSRFEGETVFWRQFEVAKAIVAANDKSVLPRLEPWLTNDDRGLRGNAAFIFGRLGDARGFDVIAAILDDHSERRAIHEISSAGTPALSAQIRQDRYYAAHLLGDLKDARAIPILASLAKDPDVKFVVPWSLAQIGGRSAIPPLMESLSDSDPTMRVIAIQALVELRATDALPQLRLLLNDDARSRVGKLESVGEAAQAAIHQLESGNR